MHGIHHPTVLQSNFSFQIVEIKKCNFIYVCIAKGVKIVCITFPISNDDCKSAGGFFIKISVEEMNKFSTLSN